MGEDSVFVVTLDPHAATGRYYGPQLLTEGDSYETTDEYLVVFAAHGPADLRGGRRSVLVVPLADVLALDEVR
jgi:hypothetical protein